MNKLKSKVRKKGSNIVYGTKSTGYSILLQAIKTAVQNKIIPKIRIHMYANNK